MKNSALAKIGITAVVALGVVGFLVKSSIGQAQHYQMVDELIASDPKTWEGHEMKVHGFVYPGSIVEKVTGQETERTFVLMKGTKTIRVFGRGPKPDTFKDQSEVVATGRVVPAAEMKDMAKRLGIEIDAAMPYVVNASELMAKCPSKYDGAQGNRKIDNKFQ